MFFIVKSVGNTVKKKGTPCIVQYSLHSVILSPSLQSPLFNFSLQASDAGRRGGLCLKLMETRFKTHMAEL